MITPTLFNIAAIVSLRPTREPFEPSRITKTKPKFKFTHPRYNTYLEEHYASIENVSAYELIAFLAYWLSHYVFYFNSLQVSKKLCLWPLNFMKRGMFSLTN